MENQDQKETYLVDDHLHLVLYEVVAQVAMNLLRVLFVWANDIIVKSGGREYPAPPRDYKMDYEPLSYPAPPPRDYESRGYPAPPRDYESRGYLAPPRDYEPRAPPRDYETRGRPAPLRDQEPRSNPVPPREYEPHGYLPPPSATGCSGAVDMKMPNSGQGFAMGPRVGNASEIMGTRSKLQDPYGRGSDFFDEIRRTKTFSGELPP